MIRLIYLFMILNSWQSPRPTIRLEYVPQCPEPMYSALLTQTPEYYHNAVKIPRVKGGWPDDNTWWAACEPRCGTDENGNEQDCFISGRGK